MRRREWVSAAAGFVAIAIAIFAVGGAFRWAQACVAAALGVALIPSLLSRRSPARISPLIAVLGVSALFTLIQLLPLPAALISWLQPTGDALRSDGTDLADVSPWRALTLDAPGSLRALTFLMIVLAVAVVALRISVSERGRYRVLASVGILCGVTAAVTGIHVLFGAHQLYGVYTPGAHPSILGPLLNENHLGGLMAMGTAVAIGLAMYPRQRSRLRAGWVVVAAACGVATVASQSRGATLALVAGVLITGGILLAQRFFGVSNNPNARRSFATSSLPIGIVAICTIVVVIYASAGGVSGQLDRTTFDEIQQPRSKFAIWRSTADLIEESPWVGVGRGAFEPAFTRSHPAAAMYSFAYVENEYLQAAVDWGIPGAIVIALGLTWIVVVGIRRWRDGPLVAAALGSLVVMALQSIVDFGIEMLGIAGPLAAVLATLTYVPLREVVGRRLLLARASVGALVIAVGASVALLLSTATTSIAEDHVRLSGRDGLRLPDLHDAIERHPLDYYGYALAATIMVRDNDPRAVRFLNHALRLHPTHPGLHHLAARMLYRARQLEQSTIEYALALHATADSRALVIEISTRFDAKHAAAAIPVDADFNAIIKLLFELNRVDIANQWLLRVLESQPGNLQACQTLYAISLQSHDLVAAEIAGRRCTTTAPSYEARVGLGRLLLDNNRPGEAITLLRDVENWPGRIDNKVAGWLIICDAKALQRQWDEAKRCLRRLDSTGYVHLEQRGEVTSRLEKVEVALRAATPTSP